MTEYYIISNADGTPRWMWPVACKSPIVLKFYNATTTKQKIFRFFLRIIFALRLQFLVFKKTKSLPLESVPGGKDWALFLGTPGPNNKKVLYSNNSKTFRKIGSAQKGIEIIEKEKYFLNYLENVSVDEPFEFPKILNMDKSSIEISELPFSKSYSKWNPNYTAAIKCFEKFEFKKMRIDQWESWGDITSRIEYLQNTDKKLPKSLVNKLCILRTDVLKLENAKFHLAHGDFTSWNTFQTTNKKLAIIDWEMAQKSASFGFDFFHFFIQQGILVERISVRDILYNITKIGLQNNLFSSEEEIQKYFKLYALYHFSYYAHLYSHQDKWHTQVNWQIEAWEEMLNLLIESWSKRQLFIVDMFEFLKEFDYAGLKLAKGKIQDLSEDSDIDLLIKKRNLKSILDWIKENPMVFKVITNKSTNYTAVSIIFMDGSRLHLDLIVELKRKDVVFHNISKFINSAIVNENGVKECNPRHTAHYIGLFYSLNKAEVPKKYKPQAQNLLPITNEYEKLVHSYYLQEPGAYDAIVKFVLADKENRGISKWLNKIGYFRDVIRRFFSEKGIVITFSGVDGAGKSTVINEVKAKLDKKFRKRVVVIRHRPSVLPILSSFKYGKEEAEKRSVNSLPRQGNNTSKIKSLMRFTYYYSDYFFGQFYIYVKYVLRGYVVLYDRYYFDMINDGKRSNMVLPKSLTRFAYRFLMKPNYNFFLYATPDTILARKQEMDEVTILQLTNEYKTLFEDLSKTNTRSQYVSINNEVLGHTISEIFQTLGLIY